MLFLPRSPRTEKGGVLFPAPRWVASPGQKRGLSENGAVFLHPSKEVGGHTLPPFFDYLVETETTQRTTKNNNNNKVPKEQQTTQTTTTTNNLVVVVALCCCSLLLLLLSHQHHNVPTRQKPDRIWAQKMKMKRDGKAKGPQKKNRASRNEVGFHGPQGHGTILVSMRLFQMGGQKKGDHSISGWDLCTPLPCPIFAPLH